MTHDPCFSRTPEARHVYNWNSILLAKRLCTSTKTNVQAIFIITPPAISQELGSVLSQNGLNWKTLSNDGRLT
jgi:hypothetical protein